MRFGRSGQDFRNGACQDEYLASRAAPDAADARRGRRASRQQAPVAPRLALDQIASGGSLFCF
jgi:hypothetical protein